MADKTSRQDDSSDVITTPNTSLHSVSVHHHRRDILTVKPPSTTHTHHHITITTTHTHHTTFNDNTANWRKLSQPRARRLLARHGPTYTSLTKLGSSGSGSGRTTTSLHHILGSRGSHEKGAQDMSGTELRMHFASMDKNAVAASIEERIRSVEVELNRLRGEREEMVRELELGDEMERAGDVDERWEEGGCGDW
ncbi:hypothetical protein GE21DRAFT_9810 [Neurospora crassa]|uniref:Uncharacterized protein n=1 Tax=Neurospora crassa (strain ATCC 24698 / 74-OR23-1A / CBS 708.71 / DSM 1257 / FGSC 987) TaxID=367110 RepID=V5IKC0_NEUCR|nr:hypothetical protein NCU17172 [Neurospora crassa OR74A]ESA41833.1 hypothetical protein NCU17172 [Neurospora crassa OR74A]KHE82582.1 hypothetical protein GE21DRAFT_9810 [Neurospora crassa]|eukprot:XP_011395351.1 hypothetical protein NCU17172 [Neurospora crassa OR74A]